jgi:hypothetical protein
MLELYDRLYDDYAEHINHPKDFYTTLSDATIAT